jgi:hypothetical protein
VPCTEPCPAGYFCNNGTGALPRSIMCSTPSTYCPRGSSKSLETPPGHYAIPVIPGSRSMFAAVAACEPGSYCSDGVRVLCPAGRFGNASLLTTSLCSGACEAGYYCADGSVNGTRESCGGVEVYCPAGTSQRVAVEDGHYSVPLSAPPVQRTDQLPCEPGYYCEQGVRRPCPPGRFGSDAKRTDDTCSGLCAAGFFCRSGAIVANETACGSPAVYCPAGSSLPLDVPAGEYSDGPAPLTANRSVACPAGSYCSGGVQRPCDAGAFGCSIRLSSPRCSGNCSAGYFCTAGATSDVEHVCAERHASQPQEVYCPSGAGEPLTVDDGHYSYGGMSIDRMTAQALCPVGSYCSFGVRVRRVVLLWLCAHKACGMLMLC